MRPPPLLSFLCFPLQPLHEVMNAWVWFFFLPPPPLPLLPSTRLFPLFFITMWFVGFFSLSFFGYSLIYCYIWFYFYFASLLPPPIPPSFFCDTASWDRSGRQPRSHTGQSTSHHNQSINQSVNQCIKSVKVSPIMLHSKRSRSLLTLQTCPHCSCPVLLLSSSLSLTPSLCLLFCLNRE